MIPSTSAAGPVPPTGQANTDFHVDLIVALMELGRQSPAQETTKPEKPAGTEQKMADLEEAAAKVEQEATAGLEVAITGLEAAVAEIKKTESEGAAAYSRQVNLDQALQGASSQVKHAVGLGD